MIAFEPSFSCYSYSEAVLAAGLTGNSATTWQTTFGTCESVIVYAHYDLLSNSSTQSLIRWFHILSIVWRVYEHVKVFIVFVWNATAIISQLGTFVLHCVATGTYLFENDGETAEGQNCRSLRAGNSISALADQTSC